MPGSLRHLTYRVLARLNRLVCRVMYGVAAPASPPLPPTGPVLLVSNHTSFSDPLVLLATAGRPVRFLMAREIYDKPGLGWVFQAFACVPVDRTSSDIAAVRTMLRVLGQGEVVGLFPEGGIREHRLDEGHPGIGYLALKSGAAVVPVSIRWDRPRPLHLLATLLVPGRVAVRYGKPLAIPQDPDPSRERIHEITAAIMRSIHDLATTSEPATDADPWTTGPGGC